MLHPALMMVFSGTMFGLWPIMAAQSGLGMLARSALVTVAGALVFIPLVLRYEPLGRIASWELAALAALMATGGILAFNCGLSQVVANQVGAYIAIMALTNCAVPVAYQAFVLGGVSTSQMLGLICAAAAVVLLTR